jgi:hypothetical protein
MSQGADAPFSQIDPLPRPLLWAGIVLIIGASSIVNYWIYRALVVYGQTYPDLVAERPVTISRAITDASISGSFAAWISIAAILLPFGMCVVGWMHVLSAQMLGRPNDVLAWVGFLAPVAQLSSAIGMVFLSHFRFPDHDELHMFGSYLFFISQSLVALIHYVGARRFRSLAPLQRLPLSRLGVRIRLWGAPVAIGLAIAYLCLFVVKDWDLGAWYPSVYWVYTRTEPVLISTFLALYLTYLIDIAILLRRRGPVLGIALRQHAIGAPEPLQGRGMGETRQDQKA